MIRTVFFDLDDTLFDHAYCAREALSHVHSLHEGLAGIPADRVAEAHGEILEDLHREVMTGRLDIDLARIERFRRLCEALDVRVEEEFPPRAAAAYREQYIASRRAVAGAARLLEEVRRHATVGIISNNLLAEQREKLRHCELDRLIDVLVVSEEAGSAKPEAAIFAIALQRAGSRPDETVMVGDSWENDVEGARRVGIPAIWINPAGLEPPDPTVPVLRSLEPPAAVARQILDVPPLRTGRASARQP